MNAMRYATGALLIVVLLLVAGYSLFDSSRHVKYIVGGTASDVAITYEDEDGNTEEVEAAPRWTYSFSAEKGDFVYISAENQGESGSVEVEIRVDGEEFESARSDAAYGTATASGSVP